MTADSADNSERSSNCVACLEPIRSGATICPHCGASQRPQRWHNFSQILKWIGGIVTIVSLVGGVITLSRFYVDWKERSDAVSEIVAAADWLISTQNYTQAWDMYAQAAELNPSSAEVRAGRFRLAQVWLRSFNVTRERTDDILTQLTEILYRGLPAAGAEQKATILAHVGYIQALRKINKLPIFADVEALFEQALAASESNVYANVMYARWLTLSRPMDEAILDRAQEYFERALLSGQEREYIRRLQMYGFVNYSYGMADELEVNALTKLIRIGNDMRKNGEGYPYREAVYKIRDGYGRTGRARHVEALIPAIPPGEHIEFYRWLIAADDDSRTNMQQQSIYIRARLNEEAGNRKTALELYRQLLPLKTRDEITALVDTSIQRLTGQLPERALARGYHDDPIDENNPFQFHLATLEHFDAKRRGPNLEQALNYFNQQLEQNPAGLTALKLSLPTFIESVLEWVKHGREIAKYNSYSTGFSRYDHTNVRNNWIDLVLLHARLLRQLDQHEQALAQIADISRPINQLDDEWRLAQARLDFEAARLYAELAARDDNASDREQALQFLQSAIEKGITDAAQVSWRDIKSKPFLQFSDEKRYRDLIRGR